MYEYKVKLDRVVDGDTVVLVVDLGFRVTITETFRLEGVNCPERFTIAGKEATAFVQSWFNNQIHGDMILRSDRPLKQEKFGRWLASIQGKTSNLNEELVKQGYAEPYMIPKKADEANWS